MTVGQGREYQFLCARAVYISLDIHSTQSIHVRGWDVAGTNVLALFFFRHEYDKSSMGVWPLSQEGIKNLHMMNLQRRPVLSNRVSTRSTSDPPMRLARR